MNVDGSIIQFLLAREFDDIACDKAARSMTVDYPLLYDEGVDMRGHAVLVPEHERPHEGLLLERSVCVCVGEESAQAAREAGFAVVQVRGDATFQHLYNYMQSVFVKNERLDAQLRAYVDTYAGFQPLLDACTAMTGYPFALIDERYHLVHQSAAQKRSDLSKPRDSSGQAMASPKPAADARALIESAVIDLFMASHEYRLMRSSRKVFAVPGSSELFMKNLFSDTGIIGTLVCQHDSDTLDARYVRHLLNYLSGFVEEMHARIGSFDASLPESTRAHELLSQLLAGGAKNHAAIEVLLAKQGHAENASYQIVHIERGFTHEGPEDQDYVALRFERACPGSCCFSAEGKLFMLADIGAGDGTSTHAFRQKIAPIARDNLSKVGMSRPFSDMRALDDARVQASGALAQGNRTDPTYWCYSFSDYALPWLVNNGAAGVSASCSCHPAITTLSAYDEEHRSDLLETLATFMRCRYSATAASRELYVARSTLLNRLERIVELTGIDLDDFEERTYLALSLSIFQQ